MPSQTLTILKSLAGNRLHFTLVLTYSATALGSSKLISLRWAGILRDEGKIWIWKGWARGDGDTKTPGSNATVPLHSILAEYLTAWRMQTSYARNNDFVFLLARFKREDADMAFQLIADSIFMISSAGASNMMGHHRGGTFPA